MSNKLLTRKEVAQMVLDEYAKRCKEVGRKQANKEFNELARHLGGFPK